MPLKFTLPFFALVLLASATPLVRRDDSGLTSADQTTILNYHNQVRRRFGAPDLVWNSNLATSAKGYAGRCIWWDHLDRGAWGENIAGADPNPFPYDLSRLVPLWAGEEPSYDWSNPGWSSSTGHFTQVVWKETTSVGCGIQYCSGRNTPAPVPSNDQWGWNGPVWGNGNTQKGWVLVCRYLSPGNYGYTADYVRNVPCPSGGTTGKGCGAGGSGTTGNPPPSQGGDDNNTPTQPSQPAQSPNPSQGGGTSTGSQGGVPQYCLDWAKTQPTYPGYHVTGSTDANGNTSCSYARDDQSSTTNTGGNTGNTGGNTGSTGGNTGSTGGNTANTSGVPQYCLDWAKTQPTYPGYHITGSTDANGSTSCSYAPDS